MTDRRYCPPITAANAPDPDGNAPLAIARLFTKRRNRRLKKRGILSAVVTKNQERGVGDGSP